MDNEKNDLINDNEGDIIVPMVFDDGTSEDFYLLAELDYKGKWYAYFEPVNPSEDFEEGDILIYEEGEDENGEEIYIPIADDKLLDVLLQQFNDELKKMQ